MKITAREAGKLILNFTGVVAVAGVATLACSSPDEKPVPPAPAPVVQTQPDYTTVEPSAAEVSCNKKDQAEYDKHSSVSYTYNAAKGTCTRLDVSGAPAPSQGGLTVHHHDSSHRSHIHCTVTFKCRAYWF